MKLIKSFVCIFVLSCSFVFGGTTMVQASSFPVELLDQPGISLMLKILLNYIYSLIEQNELNSEEEVTRKYDITGWCTIRPQSDLDVSFDYGDDVIGSPITFERYDNKNQDGVMNIYDIGMKDDDSQSLFIKTVNDSMPNVYRLITPNGWKVSEDTATGEIRLEEDTGTSNQMWEIYPDDNGMFYFYNRATGHVMDFTNKEAPETTDEVEPYGQQFALFNRKYTGWNWYFDTDFGKYYIDGIEQEGIVSPFYEEGVPGSIFTGVMYIEGKWIYIHLGEPDANFNGLVYSYDKWWYVENGEVNFNYRGIVEYNDECWYINDGTIDKSFQGSFYYDGKTWMIYDGKAESYE